MKFLKSKLAGIVIGASLFSTISFCNGIGFIQHPDSAVGDTGQVRKYIYSIEAGANIRRTDSFKDDIPENDLFSLESAEEPKTTLRLGMEIMYPIRIGKKTRSGFSGFNYEKLTKENSGYVDVEYYLSHGIFGTLNPEEFGELLTVNHKINIYSLYTGYMLRPYRHKRLIGTAFSAKLAFSYFDIQEKVLLSMDGNYVEIITPDGEDLLYETEDFSNEERLGLLAMRPGLRMDLHIGKYVSLILPEISYEILLAQEKTTAKEYRSTIDDDVLIVPPRGHNINGLTVMFGLALHY